MQNPRAHRRAIAPILPLAPRRRDLLREIPEPARREEGSVGGVAGRTPFGREAEARGNFGDLGRDDLEDAFFFEALEGVFEGFFVDGFEVAEVALVVERLAEL